MGQRQRGMSVRLARVARALYPGVSRGTRPCAGEPLSYVSVAYVLGVIAAGWYLVLPCTLLRREMRPWGFVSGVVALVFHACLALTTVSYLLACFVDPGAVPESWRPDPSRVGEKGRVEGRSGSDVVGAAAGDEAREQAAGAGVGTLSDALLQRGYDADEDDGWSDDEDRIPGAPPPPPAVVSGTPPGEAPRYCRHCCVFKPARTHHCGACRRCVLQFDHHCAFMRSSCIGFANRKFFVLFLFYASVSCAFVAVVAPFGLSRILDDMDDATAAWDVTKLMLVLLAYMLCALHAVVLAGFCGYHLYLISRNLTTLEHSDLTREDCSRYNRGFSRNWRAVFGTRPALWFLPVSLGRESDGTQWRFVEDAL